MERHDASNVLGTGGSELLWLERTENYAEKFLDHQPLIEGGSIIVFGHSGRNSPGIETALYTKKRGLFVVAVTSKNNLDKPATHSSGKRLADAADLVIDTCSPIEDAIVPVEAWSRPLSGSSTVLAMIMTHELIARTAQNLSKRGIEPAAPIPRCDAGARWTVAKTAGLVMVRQRPRPAKGVMFITIEDDTGIANLVTAQTRAAPPWRRPLISNRPAGRPERCRMSSVNGSSCWGPSPGEDLTGFRRGWSRRRCCHGWPSSTGRSRGLHG
jgi:hypothetical protein